MPAMGCAMGFRALLLCAERWMERCCDMEMIEQQYQTSRRSSKHCVRYTERNLDGERGRGDKLPTVCRLGG